MNKFKKIAAAAVLTLSVSSPAFAALVSADCVGVGQTFTLTTETTAATCYAVAALGDNNISGNPGGANPDPLFGMFDTDFGAGSMVLIDKNDDGISGVDTDAITAANSTLGGDWSFSVDTAPAGTEYFGYVLAFKTGGGFKSISTWAAFLLPDDITSGSWSTTGTNGLSHVNLYARLRDLPPPPPSPVPLPAAGFLLVGALGALGAMRRRKG